MEDIFKYCTKDQMNDFLLSLHLLPKEKNALKILYTLSNHTERHYRECKIPKRTNGFRTLHIPDPLLKSVQNNLLHQVLEQIPISIYAKAYHKGADLVSNAEPHIRKKIILKLDIEDFYDTIDYIMVYNTVFKKEIFPKPLRTLLTHLCLYNEMLPQGSPTSPAISNIVMKPFDDYIGTFCEKKNISYTRYADDLIFSGNFNIKELLHKVSAYLKKMGFTLNPKKTKVLKRNNKQFITGIIVNEKLQVDKKYRQRIRQELYYIQKFGLYSHMNRRHIENKDKYLKNLLGKIQFVLHVCPENIEFQKYRSYLLKQRKK